MEEKLRTLRGNINRVLVAKLFPKIDKIFSEYCHNTVLSPMEYCENHEDDFETIDRITSYLKDYISMYIDTEAQKWKNLVKENKSRRITIK